METTNRPSRLDRLEIFWNYYIGPWGQSGRSYGNQALLLLLLSLLLLLLLKNLRIYGMQYHMPHQFFSIS